MAGLSLLKERIGSSCCVDGTFVGASDLVPGVYEGGMKLWEGCRDIITALLRLLDCPAELLPRARPLASCRVLELGCGHGLPGIAASLAGARVVVLQDFNTDVASLALRNATANLDRRHHQHVLAGCSAWPELPRTLRCCDCEFDSTRCDVSAHSLSAAVCDSSALLPASEQYSLILSSETVYNEESIRPLLEMIRRYLAPRGKALLAQKRYYFGVGGGTKQVRKLLPPLGLHVTQCEEISDGLSNMREVLTVEHAPLEQRLSVHHDEQEQSNVTQALFGHDTDSE